MSFPEGCPVVSYLNCPLESHTPNEAKESALETHLSHSSDDTNRDCAYIASTRITQ